MSIVWLVTGSENRFGRHVGEAAMAAGDCPIAAAHDLPALQDLKNRQGDRIVTSKLHLTDALAGESVAMAAIDAFGIEVSALEPGGGPTSRSMRASQGAIEEILPDCRVSVAAGSRAMAKFPKVRVS